jgi:hypothetical protein
MRIELPKKRNCVSLASIGKALLLYMEYAIVPQSRQGMMRPALLKIPI